jgi:hypothetical protein
MFQLHTDCKEDTAHPKMMEKSTLVGSEFSVRVLSSGIYRPVVWWKSTDFSEDYVASIFRVEE